jgi:hypothetical protein
MKLRDLEETAAKLNLARELFYAECVKTIPGFEELVRWKVLQKDKGRSR